MARGKVDRRSLSDRVDWKELLSDHSSLHSCQCALHWSLQRRAEEQEQKKCRKLEHVQCAMSQIINAATSEQSRSWIQCGSWAKCLQCNALHRSKLSMDRFHDTHDFSSPLLHLTREVAHALRPLTLFQGKPTWVPQAFRNDEIEVVSRVRGGQKSVHFTLRGKNRLTAPFSISWILRGLRTGTSSRNIAKI